MPVAAACSAGICWLARTGTIRGTITGTMHTEHEHSSVICSFPPAGSWGFSICLLSTGEETPASDTRASVLKSTLGVLGALPATIRTYFC